MTITERLYSHYCCFHLHGYLHYKASTGDKPRRILLYGYAGDSPVPTMNEKHLNGTGQGEFAYDFDHDTIFFKIKDRDYKMSMEFQNFVADVDEEGLVIGVRVFDASKVFNVAKEILQGITRWEFKAAVEENTLTVTLRFVSRGQERALENFTQQLTMPLNGYHLADSAVECAV